MNRKIFLLLLLLFPAQVASKPASVLYNDGSLRITKKRAVFKDKIIYDVKRDIGEGSCPPGYTPLSCYAGIFSYMKVDWGPCKENPEGVPWNANTVTSVQLPNLRPLEITDLFSESSIVAALKKDSWLSSCDAGLGENLDSDWCIHKFLPSLKKAQKIKDIFSLFPGGDLTFDTKSFAFAGFDGKKVAVRIILMQYMGYDHYTTVQLGLLLKPKKEWLKRFANKKGFFFDGKLR